MKKRRKLIFLSLSALIVIGVLISQLSFITISNRSGAELTGIVVRSETFHLHCGTLAAGESRQFIRWARASCGVCVEGFHRGNRFVVANGFITEASHGYRIEVSMQPDLSSAIACSPAPTLNTSAFISMR